MERHLLLRMINEQMYVLLGCTVFIYFFASYVTFFLGFKIINVKISLKQLSPAACIWVFYSLAAKQFLSLNSYSAIMIPVIVLTLAVTEKIAIKGINVFTISHILKLSWTSLLMIVSNTIGFVLVVSPLSLNESIGKFFATTITGYNTVCAIETLFTLLVLFILIKYSKISLIPPIKEKITFIDVVALITYAAMFSAVYSSSVKLWTSLTKDPRQVFGDLLYQWLTVFIIVSGHWMILRNMKKKNEKLEADKKLVEEERNRLAEEKNRIEKEKDQIAVEKSQLEAEKYQLEDGKNKLEQEKENLLNQVKELIDKNNKGESLVAQELLDKCFNFFYGIQNISVHLPKRSQSQVDGEKNAINMLTGKDNKEIAAILGLNEREMAIAHLLIRGKSNKEIAECLDLNVGTTGNLVSDLLGKFKLNDRNLFLPYIIEYFIQRKLIQPDNSSK